METSRPGDVEISTALAALPAWHRRGSWLRCRFRLPTLSDAAALSADIAAAADSLAHYPDWSVHQRIIDVATTTRDSGGITERDLALARCLTECAVARGAEFVATRHQGDWTTVPAAAIPTAPGMTQLDELRYLHWVTSSTFEGLGRVVELGSFLGRTTVALASGLAASVRPDARVVSIDSHVWDPWTHERYRDNAIASLSPDQRRHLPTEVTAPPVGGTFRPLFDVFTQAVERNIEAHSWNLDDCEWTGEPIEILFVDAAKSWRTLDNIVAQFFPSLVDGATVIHQDYKHFFTYWLHPVTERMIDDGLLVPTVSVPNTSTQGFRYRRPANLDLRRYLQAAFEPDEVARSLDRSRRRYDLAEGLSVAGAQLCHLLETNRRPDAARLLAATIEAGGFRDSWCLGDLLGMADGLYEPLWDRGEIRSGRARRFGDRSVVLEPAAPNEPCVVEAVVEARQGASFVAQLGLPAGGAAGLETWMTTVSIRVTAEDDDAPRFERNLAVVSGMPRPVVAPLSDGRVRVRIATMKPLLLRAPMILRPID